MFGDNPARPQELTDGSSLWVQEIFYTLQGEGPFSGKPAVFVRLAGCNLRCFFCDTDFESSDWKPTLEEMLAKIYQCAGSLCKFVVITGGEPFRQNIAPLVEALLKAEFIVQIETNGSLWVELPKHENLHLVCSPKTSFIHPAIRERAKFFKYVVTAGGVADADGLPMISSQGRGVECMIARPTNGAEVFVMPLDENDEQKNAANLAAAADIARRHQYSLTLQIHKIAGFK